jgi:hypothetical protein
MNPSGTITNKSIHRMIQSKYEKLKAYIT